MRFELSRIPLFAALVLAVAGGAFLVSAQDEEWDDFFADGEPVAEERQLTREEVRQAGLELVTKLGCTGCHPASDPELAGLRKAGPDLRRLASKTTPGWTYRWIESPRDFRPTTWMPHFFDPGEGETEAERERREAEIRGIVAYLWQGSERPEYPPPPTGDARRGEELFAARGCTGCHLRDGEAERDAFYPEVHRLHGPNLARLGSKVGGGWLFAWLKDPKQYFPATVMPDLRLSDAEAADLTAFLLTSRDPTWEGLELSAAEGDAALGEETIRRRGCHGCHEIAGFEDAAPPAGPLASAALAAAHGPGATGSPAAGPPVIPISEREAAAIGAHLAAPAAEAGELVAAHQLLRRYNCRGCHLIEDRGHAIKATISDVGMLPPSLKSEGARVQSDWLRGYLRDPGTVRMRPWLTVEMPTFGLSDEEIETVVGYFEALEPEEVVAVPESPPEAGSVAIGAEVFALLQCGRCHPAGAEAAAALGVDAANLAPSLEIGSRRLRYGWIPLWIRDPQSWQPGTKMPTFFFPTETGEYLSPLGGSLDSPIFDEPKVRMMEHFASEEELEARLADGGAVTEALRDYVWSLGE